MRESLMDKALLRNGISGSSDPAQSERSPDRRFSIMTAASARTATARRNREEPD
jgi:hypothetical protein